MLSIDWNLIVAPMSVRSGQSRFEARFGFRFKQPLVRLRFLDGDLVNRFGFPINDFATPLDQFSDLRLAHTTILIVENEMTFLSLPPLQALSRFSEPEMLQHCFPMSIGWHPAAFSIGEIWIHMALRH